MRAATQEGINQEQSAPLASWQCIAACIAFALRKGCNGNHCWAAHFGGSGSVLSHALSVSMTKQCRTTDKS